MNICDVFLDNPRQGVEFGAKLSKKLIEGRDRFVKFFDRPTVGI